MRVLIVEDEMDIAQPLARLLQAEGWSIVVAGTAAEALEKLGQIRFDAVLLDLGLPDQSGFVVCRTVREMGDAAILVLTARSDEDSVVRALEEGADDYVIKPFRARELASRLRAIQRRRAGKRNYRFGTLRIDADAAQVFENEVPLPLTAQEYRLLLLFASNPGCVLERGVLLQALWDCGGNFVNDNTLTVTVKRLREKLGHEGARIKTVRGIGYRWEERM
ncbi:response regulator transcription factor [uncultured Ruthenibacterium sp.]|uniref:response regulator transcription factor n=1 Tax=uncultured Ruthenibacterium sp. TaxID=1905347 RepID=UPI00349EC57B